jgi:hypothetical protein
MADNTIIGSAGLNNETGAPDNTGNNKIEVKSKILALRNLGTKVSKDIREQITNQGSLLQTGSFLDYYANGTADFYRENPSLNFGGTVDGIEDSAASNEADDPKSLSLKMGLCPVVNPPWQWNELDDPPSNRAYPKIGRVYLENILSNYPIVVIEPGRAKYNTAFFNMWGTSLAGKADQLNDYIRTGGKPEGTEIIKAALSAIKNITVGVVDSLFQLLTNTEESKFMNFKPAMSLYTNYCNELLREVATNMKLLNLSDEMTQADMNAMGATYSESDDFKEEERLIVNISRRNSIIDNDENYSSDNLIASSYLGTLDALNVINFIPKSNRTIMAFTDQANRCFLPFMAQRGISCSETFTNTTETHPLASQVNSKAQELEQERGVGLWGKSVEAAMGLSKGINGSEILETLVEKFNTYMVGEALASTTELGLVFAGKGRMSFPEVWANSSFSRSYSLEFKFYSPVGDAVSIFENTRIQLLMLLALTLPLQTAKNLYTSPFCIRVYSKGLFSIDFGMIDSLVVQRGEETNNYSVQGYPRTIRVTVNLKDLSPVMMLSLGQGALSGFKRANSGLIEYLAVIGGLTIADRHSIARRWKTYWSRWWNKVTDSYLNLGSLGFNFSQSFIMKPYMFFTRANAKVDIDKIPKPNTY